MLECLTGIGNEDMKITRPVSDFRDNLTGVLSKTIGGTMAPLFAGRGAGGGTKGESWRKKHRKSSMHPRQQRQDKGDENHVRCEGSYSG